MLLYWTPYIDYSNIIRHFIKHGIFFQTRSKKCMVFVLCKWYPVNVSWTCILFFFSPNVGLPHTYEHIHIHIHTHLNLSKHTYTHILKYTCTYLSANHTNDILLSKAILSSDWVILQINWYKFTLQWSKRSLEINS